MREVRHLFGEGHKLLCNCLVGWIHASLEVPEKLVDLSGVNLQLGSEQTDTSNCTHIRGHCAIHYAEEGFFVPVMNLIETP